MYGLMMHIEHDKTSDNVDTDVTVDGTWYSLKLDDTYLGQHAK